MKILSRTILALALAALLSELALRLAFGLGHPVLFSPDPACGYLPAPSQDTTRFGAHILINHAGMRAPEFPDRKPAGVHRILFVGDSVTFGPTFVDQADIFSTLLPRALQDAGDGSWESLNASAPGWATGNELGFVKFRGTFESDIVVLVINTGDLDQPFATCNGRSNCPLQAPLSALWEAIDRYLIPRLTSPAKQAADPGSTGATEGGIPTADVIANLAAFRSIVEQQHARFILVYELARGGNWGSAYWKAAKAALDDWVRSADVPFLDLSDALSAVPVQQASFDGVHLRPLGHRIVAAQLQAFIVRPSPSQ